MNDAFRPDWNRMTYDEQRAFLGLKDVRTELAWENLARAGRGVAAAFIEMWNGIERSMRIVAQALEPTKDQTDYGLAGEK